MAPVVPAWIRELLAAYEAGETFHVVDTETTGSSARGARVIEIATVSVTKDGTIGEFESLVNPGVYVPRWITEITGITQRMLAPAPPPEHALLAWRRHHGGQGRFVAHNAPFDWAFMTMECEKAGEPWPFAEPTCTVKLARRYLKHLPSRSLENLIRHYGIPVDARHRALADARATAVVFHKMMEAARAETGDAG